MKKNALIIQPLTWLMLFILLTGAACSKQSSAGKHEAGVVVSQANMPQESPEATPKTATQSNQNSDLPASWEHTFSYFNEGGMEGQWMLGNTFELLLKSKSHELHILSESMLSPHGKLSVRAEGTEAQLNVYFLENIKGTSWDDFKPNDLLFTIQNKEGKLHTTWETLKPLYREVAKEGNFFGVE